MIDKTKEQLLQDLENISEDSKEAYLKSLLNELSLVDKDLLSFFTSEPYAENKLGYSALLQILKELKKLNENMDYFKKIFKEALTVKTLQPLDSEKLDHPGNPF